MGREDNTATQTNNPATQTNPPPTHTHAHANTACTLHVYSYACLYVYVYTYMSCLCVIHVYISWVFYVRVVFLSFPATSNATCALYMYFLVSSITHTCKSTMSHMQLGCIL